MIVGWAQHKRASCCADFTSYPEATENAICPGCASLLQIGATSFNTLRILQSRLSGVRQVQAKPKVTQGKLLPLAARWWQVDRWGKRSARTTTRLLRMIATHDIEQRRLSHRKPLIRLHVHLSFLFMFFVSRAHYHTATKLLGPGLEFKACWAAARPVVAEKVVRSSFFTLLDSPCLRLRGQGDASEGYGMALAMRMDSTGSS
jgi:hypothetical protein